MDEDSGTLTVFLCANTAEALMLIEVDGYAEKRAFYNKKNILTQWVLYLLIWL